MKLQTIKSFNWHLTNGSISGGSRPSAKEWARLTMNVEFCEDNSGTSKKMRYFRKNKMGAKAPQALPLDPPLSIVEGSLEKTRSGLEQVFLTSSLA